MSSPRSLVRSLAWTLCLGLVCAGLTASAGAADLGLPVAPQDPSLEQNVEFGTGWYIRGGVGLALQKQPSLLPDATTVPSVHSDDFMVELGGGYKFNNWLRADGTYTYYRQQQLHGNGAFVNCPSSIAGLNQQQLVNGALITIPVGLLADANQCTPGEFGTLQKNLLLANGYIDLGTWYGVTPYIGAGVGAAYMIAQQGVNFTNNSDGSPYRANLTPPSGFPVVFYSQANGLGQQFILNPQPHFNFGPQNWDFSRTTHNLSFAFALMAGFAYDITDHMKLDISYRYVNFGTFSGISSLSQTFLSSQVTTQEVRVGLRYQID